MKTMIASGTNAAMLYPRSVKPAMGPLPLYRFVYEFVRNPLRVVPEEVYHEKLVIRARLAGRKTAWITDPELIEEVLVKNTSSTARSSLEKRALGGIIGEGILTSDGPLWRWQRRTLAPLFRAQDIQAYIPVMAKAAEEQTAHWRRQGPGLKRIDKDMTGTTFAVIARTMLVGGEPAETETIKRATERYLSHISWEIAYAILGFPNWMPHPGTLGMRRAAKQLRTSIKFLIARRVAGESGSHDLLARLLAARNPETGQPMTETQLIDNLLTLLEAGHETTARALTWTLYLLARAPEWQTAARAEVNGVAGRDTITAAHLPHMPIVHQVLNESMRLYPPAPSVLRTVTRPLSIGTEKLSPGDLAIIPIYCVHRHRRLWANPDCFDPARFAPEAAKSYPRTQYMPFGAGPRICLGSAFAMTEAGVLLATFLRDAEFDWSAKREPEPISRITLRPRGGMRLRVRPI